MNIFGKKAENFKELERRNRELYDELLKVKLNNNYFKQRVEELEEELKGIKPVVEHKGFKEAVCSCCENCKFAVFSKYGCHELVGCGKDIVCDNYEPRFTPEDD
jgi:hypothetical protein